MQVLLVSTYELGRQPFGLASPAAWLKRAGFAVRCADLSLEPLQDEVVEAARLVAFHLPMHTATRLALPVIDRARRLNPSAHICCYGLYAPLNDGALRAAGADTILGPEFEAELTELAHRLAATQGDAADPGPLSSGPLSQSGGPLARLAFIQPDRRDLPGLSHYAALVVDGTRLVAGYTEASRGCKHACRHCPIVPVYGGRFRVVPVDVVLADVRAQVGDGARHVTFGDPDFLNGPRHALHVVEAFAHEFPSVTYDVTIKIEHLLRHAELLPRLAETGCLFVTSAVESVDDQVLARLAKGHTRADLERAVRLCREAGLLLAPTFVAFTPWTTLDGYVDLLDEIERLELVAQVSPIQLALRLLIPSGSLLMDLEEIRRLVGPFDPAALVYPWVHPDPRVDALQDAIVKLVGMHKATSRDDTFEAVREAACLAAGRAASSPPRRAPGRARSTVPYLEEPWYC